uniref:Uncharacterized protein n=1 Tax=Timema bartmani TaxID=61472 RepID=A0A7R9EP91_9NEOP|nr:unnamed protein product [Timema bartmani]
MGRLVFALPDLRLVAHQGVPPKFRLEHSVRFPPEVRPCNAPRGTAVWNILCAFHRRSAHVTHRAEPPCGTLCALSTGGLPIIHHVPKKPTSASINRSESYKERVHQKGTCAICLTPKLRHCHQVCVRTRHLRKLYRERPEVDGSKISPSYTHPGFKPRPSRQCKAILEEHDIMVPVPTESGYTHTNYKSHLTPVDYLASFGSR